jgi:hypothetical protein
MGDSPIQPPFPPKPPQGPPPPGKPQPPQPVPAVVDDEWGASGVPPRREIFDALDAEEGEQ